LLKESRPQWTSNRKSPRKGDIENGSIPASLHPSETSSLLRGWGAAHLHPSTLPFHNGSIVVDGNADELVRDYLDRLTTRGSLAGTLAARPPKVSK